MGWSFILLSCCGRLIICYEYKGQKWHNAFRGCKVPENKGAIQLFVCVLCHNLLEGGYSSAVIDSLEKLGSARKLGVLSHPVNLIKQPCLKVIAAITARQIIEKHEEKSQILRFFVSQHLKEVFTGLCLPVFCSIRTPVMTIFWCCSRCCYGYCV